MESLGLSQKGAQFWNKWRRNKVHLEVWPLKREYLRMCTCVCLSVHCRYCVEIVVRLFMPSDSSIILFYRIQAAVKTIDGGAVRRGGGQTCFFSRDVDDCLIKGTT